MALLVFIATGVLLVAILLWGIGSGLARLVGIIMFIDGRVSHGRDVLVGN